MGKMTREGAIQAIETAGAMLVYPIHNQKEPASLWSHFFPRSPMKWEWTENGDDRVARLWLLREELARSRRVVYAKWFRGRATFFSRRLFPALLKTLVPDGDGTRSLTREARALYGILEETSPLSTKELKRAARLEGRFEERGYDRRLKELWQRLLIVGFGEQDDGAFPSLIMGTTKLLFEDLWDEARKLPLDEARRRIERAWPLKSPFRKVWDKSFAEFGQAERVAPKVLLGFTPLD